MRLGAARHGEQASGRPSKPVFVIRENAKTSFRRFPRVRAFA